MRELRNAVERAVLLGALGSEVFTPTAPALDEVPEASTLEPDEASLAVEAAAQADASLRSGLAFRAAKEAAVAQWERNYLSRLMRDRWQPVARRPLGADR